MLHPRNIKLKQRLEFYTLLPLFISIGTLITVRVPAYATSLPTVTATFMDPVGTTSLQPGEHAGDAGNFYVPVKIDVQNTSSLSVSVQAATADLVGTMNSNNKISPVPSGAEYTIGQMENQWGYRWSLGDKINDSPINGPNPKNYQQMPTVSTLLDTIPVSGSRNNTVTKYLTLGFGVGVNGETSSDTYTNEVTVSVVASPLKTTLFDITYMQEMTADICHNTITPAYKTIWTGAEINVGSNGTSYTNFIDTDGSKQLLDNATDYVPQKELIDKRDGKKYTIRKLADGNCWMVSNLEFDLVPTANKDITAGTTPTNAFSTNGTDKVTGTQITLTNEDTDLNSITTWTPAIAAELYGTAGTVYKTQRNAGKGEGVEGNASATTATKWDSNGTGGLRSFSSAAGYPNALYSTKTAFSPTFGTAKTGEPWQRFGNFYNWTAATLGSSQKILTNINTDFTAFDGKNAADSICPKGWKLPESDGDDSFYNLITTTYGLANNSTGANQLANFPLNFLRTGSYRYSDGMVVNRLSAARWWTATNVSGQTIGTIRANTTVVDPSYPNERGNGFAIRCVAR